MAVNQIELDLLRTLPTNKYYDKPDAKGVSWGVIRWEEGVGVVIRGVGE